MMAWDFSRRKKATVSKLSRKMEPIFTFRKEKNSTVGHSWGGLLECLKRRYSPSGISFDRQKRCTKIN